MASGLRGNWSLVELPFGGVPANDQRFVSNDQHSNAPISAVVTRGCQLVFKTIVTQERDGERAQQHATQQPGDQLHPNRLGQSFGVVAPFFSE